jgi:hypothetical protein
MSRVGLMVVFAMQGYAATMPGGAARAVPAPPGTAQAAYVGYVLGVHAFDMTLETSLPPSNYRVAASFRLAGVLGALWPADGSTVVDGAFKDDGRAVPHEMVSRGRYWGTAHVMRVEWKDGLPTVVELKPPAEKDREPVPVRDQANTVDTLSAVAEITQMVAAHGRCDMTARTYDGSRLSELAARTVGTEVLKPTDRSPFQGEALRCELTGRMIGGFLRDDDNAVSRRPKVADVWFARLRPDEPPIPVRMNFSQPGSPGATAYLAR